MVKTDKACHLSLRIQYTRLTPDALAMATWAVSANWGHQRQMAQRNGRRKDRVARALYASACQAKMALQQQEIKVLEVEKVLTKLKQDARALTQRIETLHTDHHVLVEAIRKEEQDLQVETWLRDEELKLLTLLSQRHGHAHHVLEHGLIV